MSFAKLILRSRGHPSRVRAILLLALFCCSGVSSLPFFGIIQTALPTFARNKLTPLSASHPQNIDVQVDASKILFPFVEAYRTPPAPVVISEILASNGHVNIDPDFHAFSDWIELQNLGNVPIDLSGYFLTDNRNKPTKWQIPAETIIPAGGFLLIWADQQDTGLHTNFSLSQYGEEVMLFAPDGLLISSLRFLAQQTNFSYGRAAPSSDRTQFFAEPSPGRPNAGIKSNSLTATVSPQISLSSGFRANPHLVSISAAPEATIRYTLDGSIPTSDSALYMSPFAIYATTVLKVRAFEQNRLSSPVVTRTYFVNEPRTLPTISLSTDPSNLWDDTHGIYVERDIRERKDWERPVTIEYFDSQGNLGFEAEMNMRLFGNSAFLLPQKSLSLIAKSKLGTERIEYPLFSDHPVQSFKSIILRSSSDDWNSTLIRDAMMQSLLVGEADLDLQAYQPAVLFMNGEYFGIHNIREKYSEHYIADHHNMDKDSIDLVKQNLRFDTLEATAGDLTGFNELLQFVTERKPFSSKDYAEFEKMVDVQNYMDYVIAVAYFSNTSWGHNRRLWRTNAGEGRWRSMLFDLDRGFREDEHDTLAFFIDQDLIFGGLWSYPPFRDRFNKRMAQHIATTFEPQRVQTMINRLEDQIAPEIERHIARWKNICWSNVCGISSTGFWQRELNKLRDFSTRREMSIRNNLNVHLRRAATEQGLPSVISTDTVLTKAESPYVIKNDLVIDEDTILSAEPGVEIYIAHDKDIRVSGAIQLAGTKSDPVKILPLEADAPWGAIIIEDATSPSEFYNVIVRSGSHGDDADKYRAAITSIRSNVTIDGLDIAEIRGSAIYMNASSLTLRNCLVDMPAGQTGNLIDIEYGTTLIEHCHINGHDTCCINAIDLDYVQAATVRNTSILGFAGQDSDGIDVGNGSRNVLAEWNVISNCGDKGISIGETSVVTARYNTITNCMMGIAVKDNSNAIIDHNVLHGNDIGVNVYNLLGGFGGGIAFVSNTIISNSITTAARVDQQSVLEIKYSLSNTSPLEGNSNLWAEPYFVNPTGMNFLVKKNSPVIDAGDPTAEPDLDGSITDIGVFSFLPVEHYLPIISH